MGGGGKRRIKKNIYKIRRREHDNAKIKEKKNKIYLNSSDGAKEKNMRITIDVKIIKKEEKSTKEKIKKKS